MIKLFPATWTLFFGFELYVSVMAFFLSMLLFGSSATATARASRFEYDWRMASYNIF